MNVGIQETDHFEGVYPVIRLFDNGKNRLFIFVNQEIHRRLLHLLGNRANNYRWIIQGENEPTWRFCRKIRSTILDHKIGLLYLNTVSKHHIWYALFLPFDKIPQSILTVHDVNCLFKEQPGPSPRSWIKYLGKKLLAARVKAFNTVSETVQPYLLSMVKKPQQVFTVPGAFFDPEFIKTTQATLLHIVVPGSIDPKRRDYYQVFQLLDQLAELPVKITLLGGGKGDYAANIWRQCRSAQSGKLAWFEKDIVDQPEFDAIMNAAHFVWVPSVVETNICGSIPETYGITKSSGNIFDIIKHAKPFFFPGNLQVPEILKASGISYSAINDIARAASYYAANPAAYAEISKAAENASQHFTIENLRLIHSPLFD